MHDSSSAAPIVRDLVLIGGGHAHVAVLKRFGMRPMAGVRVTLIARDVLTPYSGMIPGYIAGRYSLEECHIDLRRLCRFAGARLVHASATGLDLEARHVALGERPPLSFDVLSIDIGSTPDIADIDGAETHGVPVKPIDRFIEYWRALHEEIDASQTRRVVVVGDGAGGIELALNLQVRLHAQLEAAGRSAERVQIALVGANETIMPTHAPGARKRLRRILETRGIDVHLEAQVVAVDADALTTADGEAIPYDDVIWVTGAAPAGWLTETGLALDDDGFIAIDATLRSTSHPFVFAAGDVASNIAHPRPKSGVFAVRQGPPLADNLRRALRGDPPARFKPQRAFLSLIGTGDEHAVASRGPFSFEGRWVWRLKDWIDRRWMDSYNDLEPMSADEDAASSDETALASAGDASLEDTLTALKQRPMRCAGCGAKVGASVLEQALGEVRARHVASPSDDLVVGLGAPDDASVMRVGPGELVVQSVDFFPAIVDDPWLFGRIAANHALGDLHAMNARPTTALAIATLPFGTEERMRAELVQLLDGGWTALEEDGCTLAGGHTTEGPELVLGFQVTGVAHESSLLRKNGLRPGDALVLTRPVGTGVLFAAEMRGQARAAWIEAALEQMVQSNLGAVRVLADHDTSACTDVTGFGLAGHLAELLMASDCDARLAPARVALLDGALECAREGISSSLQPQNLRARRWMEVQADVEPDRLALLFDPQTAGGLLAGVPASQAEDCLSALQSAGYPLAGIVGRVLPRTGPDPTIYCVNASQLEE